MSIGGQWVLAAFLIFCRIGACMAVVPGLSSPRLPARARLLAALALTLALSPSFMDQAQKSLGAGDPPTLFLLIGSEFVIGFTLGLIVRLLFAALETMASAASMSIGLSSMYAQRVEESDQLPELAGLVLLVATTLFFISDLHIEVLRALADSYGVFPVGAGLDPGRALERIGTTLGQSFLVTLRLMSPLLIFGLVVNVALALLNRAAPQIAVYFISAPVVVIGGLFILYLSYERILLLFMRTTVETIRRL